MTTAAKKYLNEKAWEDVKMWMTVNFFPRSGGIYEQCRIVRYEQQWYDDGMAVRAGWGCSSSSGWWAVSDTMASLSPPLQGSPTPSPTPASASSTNPFSQAQCSNPISILPQHCSASTEMWLHRCAAFQLLEYKKGCLEGMFSNCNSNCNGALHSLHRIESQITLWQCAGYFALCWLVGLQLCWFAIVLHGWFAIV